MPGLATRSILILIVVATQLLAMPVMSRESGPMAGIGQWDDFAGPTDCTMRDCVKTAHEGMAACSSVCSATAATVSRSDARTQNWTEAAFPSISKKWSSWLNGPDPFPPKTTR